MKLTARPFKNQLTPKTIENVKATLKWIVVVRGHFEWIKLHRIRELSQRKMESKCVRGGWCCAVNIAFAGSK